MTQSKSTVLRDILLSEYNDLARRLTRRLQSSEAAYEVLHETFLRIQRLPDAQMRSPRAYLFRIALNIAADRQRAGKRLLTQTEADALLDIPDDTPGPEQAMAARSELEFLRKVIAELPERRRAILVAARIEGVPHRDIASRYSVTTRTVEIEIKHALEHCSQRLKRHPSV